MDQRLTRHLLGQDPRNVDKLFTDMMHSISASGFYQGAVMSAISGIEMALWDITGQDLGCPIWQLLGGKFRDRIRLYNDCHEGEEDTPEGGVETAKAVEARGFDAIKFDIDPRPSRRDAYNRTISNDDIDQFVRVVAAVREALDSNTDLLIHAHWFYAPPDILKVAKAFESLNLMWLEDPIPPENIEAMLWQRSPDPPQPQSERARTSTHATVSGTSSSNRLRNHLPLPRKSRRIARGTPYRRSCGHVLHSVLTS